MPYKLPPDVVCKEVRVPLAEVLDWSLQFLGIPPLWKENAGWINNPASGVNRPVRIAVLDTGCDLSHPDLRDAISGARDFTGSRYGPVDRSGHGTHVAGLIGARANDVGVRGVAWRCQLLIGKVLGDDGGGTDDSIRAGVRWAIDSGADFISNSYGGGGSSAFIEGMLREYSKVGTDGISGDGRGFFFAASGNDGRRVNWPGSSPNSISVGAADKDGNLTDFSSRGENLDIIGPGTEMISTIPGGRYGRMTGSSMSCPLVCGIGAIAYGKHRSIGGDTPLDDLAEMRQHLQATGKDTASGYKLIWPAGLMADSKSEVPDPPARPWYRRFGVDPLHVHEGKVGPFFYWSDK